jgi:hypothetical protein
MSSVKLGTGLRGLLLASALAAPASGAMVQQVDEVVDRRVLINRGRPLRVT